MPDNTTTHRSIPANQLSREDRQRLEQALLYQPNQKAFWLASGGVAAFGALVVGAMASKLGMMGVVFAAAAAAWVVLAAIVVIRQIVRARGVPFGAGLYATGHEIIDATGQELKIYSLVNNAPMVTSTRVSRQGHGYLFTRVKIATRERTFRFIVHDEERARASVERLLANVGAAREFVHAQGASAIRQYELAYVG